MKMKLQVIIMGMLICLTTSTIYMGIDRQLGNKKGRCSEEVMEVKAADVEEEGELKNTEVTFVENNSEYFKDALFIGDSRTVGLCEYGTIKEADYFASTGMNIYKLWDETVSVENVGRVTLGELLEIKDYGKVYIMLGINELGYQQEKTLELYQKTLDKLKEKEADALFFVCANLHITETRSQSDKIINNDNINLFNRKLEGLTDNQGIYYIDVNEIFDDERGHLRAECTSDHVHVLAKYYQDWSEWLCKHTVQRGK